MSDRDLLLGVKAGYSLLLGDCYPMAIKQLVDAFLLDLLGRTTFHWQMFLHLAPWMLYLLDLLQLFIAVGQMSIPSTLNPWPISLPHTTPIAESNKGFQRQSQGVLARCNNRSPPPFGAHFEEHCFFVCAKPSPTHTH